MNKSISQQIESLSALTRPQVISIWFEIVRQAPPPTLHRSLMISILAYRIQEREFGGLSNSARQKIKQLGKALRSENRIQTARPSPLKSGTRLIRSWGRGSPRSKHQRIWLRIPREAVHEPFGDSEREITGTRWSGPLFFGTKKEVA